MNVVYRKIVKLLQIIISVFIKQNNDLILIASCHGNRFADNSKYFFKHLVKYEYKNFYLLTKDKNLYISFKTCGVAVAVTASNGISGKIFLRISNF